MPNRIDVSSVSGKDLMGKIVILRQSFFRKGMVNTDHPFRCEAGFGCSPTAMGRAVFGQFLSDGERCRIDRGQVERFAMNGEVVRVVDGQKEEEQ